MTLVVRKPDIVREDADLAWSPVPEFAHILNGASVVIPIVEHFLNNVMQEVRRDYCAERPALAEEIDLFIKQESQHSRLHNIFNKRMFAAGYSGLEPVIARAVADLRDLRQKHALAFNVAYCAGFETTATFSAQYLLEHCDAYFKGGDAFGANLLQWHVAEEFEHRTSCHRALEAVGGGYWLRLAGFAYSFWHINLLFGAATAAILNVSRAGMSPAQRRGSVRVAWGVRLRQLAYMLPGLCRLLLPGYDPARIAVSPKIACALAYFRQQGPIIANFADMRDGMVRPSQT